MRSQRPKNLADIFLKVGELMPRQTFTKAFNSMAPTVQFVTASQRKL